MKNNRKITIFTFTIFFLLLLIISLLIMYHSQFISSLYSKHFQKQLIWIIIGFIIFLALYFIPKKYLFKYSKLLYIINLIMLLLVLIIGKNVNGATAWLKIGNFQFQPSELMKLSYTLFLASFCSNRSFYTLKDEFKFIFKVIIIFLIPSILVFLEPDTGAIIFFLLIAIIIIKRKKKRIVVSSNITKLW